MEEVLVWMGWTSEGEVVCISQHLDLLLMLGREYQTSSESHKDEDSLSEISQKSHQRMALKMSMDEYTMEHLNKGHVGDNINSLVLSFVERLSSSRML